ncbi:MAG TPA: tetratricopeptide repeat protein [Stenomitos sp.]
MKRLAALVLILGVGMGMFTQPLPSIASDLPCTSETAARKAAQTSPSSLSFLGLGLSLSCHNKLPEAIAVFRQIIQKDPAFAAGFNVYSDLGHALQRAGNSEAAIATYQKAIQYHADPQSGAYEALSKLLRQQGRIQEADAVLKKKPQFDSEGGG